MFTHTGKKGLLIDNDLQGSATLALGYPQPDEIEVTLSTIMEKVINEEEFDPCEGILHHEEGIDLLPANIELSGVESSRSTRPTLSKYQVCRIYG